jgi:hypothetical protein
MLQSTDRYYSAEGGRRMSEVCLVTIGDMTERFEDLLIQLTNMELDALAYLCSVYKEEEE